MFSAALFGCCGQVSLCRSGEDNEEKSGFICNLNINIEIVIGEVVKLEDCTEIRPSVHSTEVSLSKTTLTECCPDLPVLPSEVEKNLRTKPFF